MFLYIPNVFATSDYRHLCTELSNQPFSDENNHMAPGRLRTYITPESKTYRILTSPEFMRYMSFIFETPLIHGAEHIPIEYRKYPVGSRGMAWHRDTCLVGCQYECVYTLTNTSDSQTQYKDLFGRVHSVRTEPNSLIVVRAGGVEHAVTPVTVGERTILKFACLKASSS